ncbi:MAG TPA: NDP-sugar synthase [Anaerolineae bacterium]|nr:NDP-sugar synthase [Anaerolineae bacterium]
MQALILAGGEGKRMRRVTAHVPKPLLYLPGGTLLEHQLALLSELAVTHVFVITRHRHRDVSHALKGLQTVTPVQQKPPFTLLGALASAEGLVTEPFIVIHGDNYFSHDLGYLAGEAVCVHGGSWPEAVFATDEEGSSADVAGRLASTGCYVLSPRVFGVVREFVDHDDLRSLTAALLESGAVVRAVRLQGWRTNINELRDLLAVSRLVLEQWSDTFHTPAAQEGYRRTTEYSGGECGIWVSHEARISRSDLGPSVVVGPQATVRGCVLRNAIVFPGTEIEGERVADGIVIPTPDGPLVLAPDRDVDRGQESEAEEEPTQLPPSADE